jgi:hypothetical protein
MAGDREDAQSFAVWIRLSYLGLVRVLESEVPSDAVSFGLVKRKAEEYNLHLWTASARAVMLVTLRSLGVTQNIE